jgi:hypothetical protein
VTYFRLHPSTLRYRPKFPSSKKEEADTAIVDLSLEHPELGSDKVGRLVRNRGLRVSSERVRQVRREECLQVPPPKKKQSRRGTSAGLHPTKAEYRGHAWTWDLSHAILSDGRLGVALLLVKPDGTLRSPLGQSQPQVSQDRP